MSRLRLSGFLLFLSFGCIVAQIAPPTKQTPPVAASTAPVRIDDATLFEVQGILSFTADQRAAAINHRIKALSKDVQFKPESLILSELDGSTDIASGDVILMSVTDQDAKAAGTSRQTLAQMHLEKIRAAIVASRQLHSTRSIVTGSLLAFLATVVLIVLLRLLVVVSTQVHRTIDAWPGRVLPSVRIQKFELLGADRIAQLAVGVVRLLRFGLVLLLLYSYTSLVLGFFPWTRSYSGLLLYYLLTPLRLIGASFVRSVPNILMIGVIFVVARFVIKFVHVLFTEIEKGNVTLPNFYADWAQPTYKILRTLILLLTAVAAFPYLPGASSPAFQGISIFLGVLVSLGSTSAVANMVAGVILIYMRAFRIGDRVRIADTEGDVMQKTLLVTRVLTVKNVEVTIANAMVLSSHIVNYSASAQGPGLILHTAVTIGYDTPWRTVHQLLIDAALACDGILHTPMPFVYQTALDEFYVRYEINAYTKQPNRMAQIYADLHALIQDKFNEQGVEIMSSHYTNVRDGNRTTTPTEYLPPDYATPSFRVAAPEPSNDLRSPVEITK